MHRKKWDNEKNGPQKDDAGFEDSAQINGSF